jgi:hypothetical protein
MSDWLVPISRHLRFALTSGRTAGGTYAALQDAALNGRLAKVVCEVRGPLVDVQSGDTIWLFTPELDVGVFAVGKARRPTKTKNATVTIALDKAPTRILAADPLPAPTIRRWVPELRQGAVVLDVRPRALNVLHGWERDRAERDVELLEPLDITPWRQATRGTGDAQPATNDVLGPIARLLRSQDFAVGVHPRAGSADPWLVARRVRDVVIIGVERIRSGRGAVEAYAAVGPLREYRWRLEREPRGELRLRASIWSAFTGRPHDDVVSFLEDDEVLVSWLQRAGVVELTDRSKQRWYQYLGVR